MLARLPFTPSHLPPDHHPSFYCPTCLRVVGAPPSAAPVPQLAFPVRIDLVLADYRKKSTGVQAAALAPGSVHIHTFPKEIPDDWDPQRSLVVFPSENAVTLEEIDPQELAGVERFVILDSRWNNTTRVRTCSARGLRGRPGWD